MQQGAVVLRRGMGAGEVPLLVRLLGKLVLEVLPAALASVIGAFMFAHYQFGYLPAAGSASAPAPAMAPASAEMVQLIRDEHDMIRDYLLAQRVSEKSRAAAADAADARAAADVKLAATASRRAVVAAAVAKPIVPSDRPIAVAAAATPVGTSPATTALPQAVIAGVAQDGGLAPSETPAPVHASLVGTTLAIPGHVVAATLHAVMAIGGIPSWFGHRFGADQLDSNALPSSTAS